MKFLKLSLTGLLVALASLVLAPKVSAQANGTNTVSINSSVCNTLTPCNLQLYKTLLAAGQTSCPAVGSAYSLVTATSATPIVAQVNTLWTYADTAIVVGSSYCYYATVTFTSGGGASPPALPVLGAAPFQVPAVAPVVTVVYTPAP
jgi:hypothetical protein